MSATLGGILCGSTIGAGWAYGDGHWVLGTLLLGMSIAAVGWSLCRASDLPADRLDEVAETWTEQPYDQELDHPDFVAWEQEVSA